MAIRLERTCFLSVLTTCAILLWATGNDPVSSVIAQTQYPNAGRVDFYKFTDGNFDQFTRSPNSTMQEWMRTHYVRLLTYSPYFDSRLSWYSNAWVYKDLYAIYRDQNELSGTNPDWILKDGNGNRLYIPYACSGGACTQYAGDIGNPGFRAAWIGKARQTLARGYVGLFVDDVNLTWRISDGYGRERVPVDPRTGQEMTLETWQRYVAEFTEQIRASFPNKEVVHNVIWFAGSPRNPFISREIRAATHIHFERGVVDSGLRGSGSWSLATFLGFVDSVHSLGRGVVFDVSSARNQQEIEYGLAGWLVVSEGNDAFGARSHSSPNDWWTGYDLNLGTGYGRRYNWNGLIRRDFARGIVLLNQPDTSPRTINLGQNYKTLDGALVSSVTLDPATGAILLKP